MTLAEAAERLRALHSRPEPLILPNAWDAASARAVVEAGFPVVATTSSGVAAALGWADGEGTPSDEMFAAIGRISRVVDVPVRPVYGPSWRSGLRPLRVALPIAWLLLRRFLRRVRAMSSGAPAIDAAVVATDAAPVVVENAAGAGAPT